MSVQLGDTVKDKVTGFTGKVTGKSTYLTGLPRATVETLSAETGRVIAEYFDEVRLEVLTEAQPES